MRFPLTLLLMIALSACTISWQPAPRPTALPTFTPTVPTPRPTVTITPVQPTHTPVILGGRPPEQSTPIPTPPPRNCTDNAEFVDDVTIPDDAPLTIATEAVKTWRIRNIGTCPWDGDYALVRVPSEGGSPIYEAAFPRTLGAYPLPVVEPGDEVDLSVTIGLSTVAEAGETYRANFRLQDPRGRIFGPTIYVQIVAEGGG